MYHVPLPLLLFKLLEGKMLPFANCSILLLKGHEQKEQLSFQNQVESGVGKEKIGNTTNLGGF